MKHTAVKPVRSPSTVWVSGPLFILFSTLIFPPTLSADRPVVPVDAISVLTDGSNAGESDAVPILLSDVQFEAFLILTGRNGPNDGFAEPSDDDWQRAKERAVIIRLLANQARRLHESASEDDKIILRSEISAGFGDAAAMHRLLTRIGMAADAVDRWVENAALALGRLRFLRDQSRMPYAAAQDRSSNTARSENAGTARDTVRGYRRMIDHKIGNEELRKWIIEITEENHIRVLR